MEGKHKQASNWSRLGSTWWKLDSTQVWWLNGNWVGLLTVNVEFLLWHHDSQNQNKSHMQDCMSLQWSQMSRSWGFVEPLVQVHSQNLSNLTNHCLPFGFCGIPYNLHQLLCQFLHEDQGTWAETWPESCFLEWNNIESSQCSEVSNIVL